MTQPLKLKELLVLYSRYKAVNEQVQQVGRRLARAKLQKSADAALTDEYTTLRRELEELSDSMTFSGPTVWMRYKFEAYKDEAQPICTMYEFRLHCSKPGYICTKRFEFVNQSLVSHGLPPLSSAHDFPDDMSLDIAAQAVAPLEADAEFMKVWTDYEYYRDHEGRVAKWATFSA